MKSTLLAVGAALILIVGAVFLSGGTESGGGNDFQNVSIIDGKQIIEIKARGGYSPRTTLAKADIQTVLKVETSGTFDCSSALVIPSIEYRSNLPPSGETLIDLPPQKAGTVLQGRCSMGMYNFSITFEP